MRKIYLDELPKRGKVRDWKKSIGLKIPFVYDDIIGEIEILEHKPKESKLLVSYKDSSLFISIGNFTNCKISTLIGKSKKESYGSYKYNIGDIIKCDKKSDIKILEKIRIGDYKQKGYRYECLICGNIDKMLEGNIIKGRSCNVCGHRKLLIGINDIWTTHPNIAKFLEDKDIGYGVMSKSNKKVKFKCPICGYTEDKQVCNVTMRGFSCSKCGDGISYPEKIVYNLLLERFNNVKREKVFEWAKNKRYDFYISEIDCIIEVQGRQHYETWSFDKSSKLQSLNNRMKNDKMKKKVALSNGIKQYIEIDARISDLEYIKNSIANSEISYILDIDKNTWEKIEKNSISSIIDVICYQWNCLRISANSIANQLGYSRPTIVKYLKIGSRLGLCDYSYDTIMQRKKEKLSRSIICTTTNEVFSSLTLAANKYNIQRSNMTGCCKGTHVCSIVDDDTGKRLKWMYYNEYLSNKQ